MSLVGDLTGSWRGMYTYAEDGFSNDFAVDLRDIGGVLTGETREASDCVEDLYAEQTAFISGHRAGARVQFIKRYDEIHRDIVHYDGELDADGVEISGRWTIQGVWSGTFIMIRPRIAVAEHHALAAVPVA